MEVVRRFWRGRMVPLWAAFAALVGGFLEAAAFRAELAFDVLAGRVPRGAERRVWNRSAETPALVDVYDWTTDRLLFSVLVWPSLESDPQAADRVYLQRVEEVKGVIAKGAAEMAWSTSWEVDWGLSWDAKREVWAGSDGFAYDGAGLRAYSRQGGTDA